MLGLHVMPTVLRTWLLVSPVLSNDLNEWNYFERFEPLLLYLRPFPRPEDMAGDAVATAKLQLGFHLVTDTLSVTAARMEAAARWRMDRTWHIPFKDHPLLHAIRVRDGNCR